MKRRMRNRTYGVVRGGQGQPNRLLDSARDMCAVLAGASPVVGLIVK